MKFLLGTLAIIACAGSASSQTLVQTSTQSFNFTPSGSANLSFDKFDTLGGTRTLTGMTITVSFTRTGGSLAVDNDSTESGTVTLVNRVEGSLKNKDNTPILTSGFSNVIDPSEVFAENSTTHSIGATTGDLTNRFDTTNGADYYFWEPDTATVSKSGDVGAFLFSKYTGTGTYDLVFSATQTTLATGTSGLQQSITVSNLAGTVTVDYLYTSLAAVPEASTALLSIASIAGFALRRRRP